MTIGQKVMGLAHGAVFASVCFLMLTGCDQQPANPPAEGNKTLALEYVSQGSYNAFPLDTSHANSSFLPAGIDLEICANPTHPAVYRPPFDPIDATNLLNYMKAVTQRNSAHEPAYERHVIAIAAFVKPPPDTIVYDYVHAGATMNFSDFEYNETVSFVCVGLLNARFSDANRHEGVSGTTVHEIGHNATTFTTAGPTIGDCTSDPP